MNLQSLIVAVCVLAALLYLLRAAFRRWSASRAAGSALPSQGGASACGACQGCARGGAGQGSGESSGGCH